MADLEVKTNRLTPEQETEYNQLTNPKDKLKYILSLEDSTNNENYAPQQEGRGLGDVAREFFLPLASAAWDYTKDMPDEWDSAEGLKRKAIRGAGIAGDVALTAVPVGKMATGAVAGSRIAKPIIANAGKIANASHGGALAKEANYAKNAIKSGIEGGIDAAVYDTAVNTANEGELTGPGIGAVAGGSLAQGAAGGFLGGRQNNIQYGAKDALAMYKTEYAKTIKEQHGAKKAIRAGASSSNENVNFAQKITGLKGDEAIEKVITSNMKSGETVPQVIDRLKKQMDEANNTFGNIMGEHGDLPLKTPLNKIGDDLEAKVRNSVGIGYKQDEKIAEHFREIFNNDLAALARIELQKRGKTEADIKNILNPSGDDNLRMENVYKVLGNSITLNQIDQIKRNMWEKTGLFRRNALSMQEAGVKNIASQQGGYALLDHLRDYSDKELEVLEKIGGSIDGELNKLGLRYLSNIKKDGVVSGDIIKKYNDINKERSDLIGTKKIFDGALKNLERSGKADLTIRSNKEWHDIARKAAEEKLANTRRFGQGKLNLPDNKQELIELSKPFAAPFYSLDRMAGQGGQRLGRTVMPPQKNTLGLTPPRQ